jgi:tetratricopeptide (TPR) repeat protein
MLRIAEELDVDYVIFGTFGSNGSTLTVESRILRVNPAALLPAVRESGPLDSLMDLQTRLAWRTLSSNDSSYPLSLPEFSKKQRPLRLDAFEHYTRGLLAADDEARLRELREAARLEPDWPEPDFWLGEVYFSRRDCNSALPWYARIPAKHDRYAEAVFATGVCRLMLSQPDRAEEVFTSLRESLRENGTGAPGASSVIAGGDLPEILNNLALAKARLGNTSGAQTDLQRAADLDPDEDDYPFNLGLLALQGNDPGNAAGYFLEASEREPDNPEDRALLMFALEKAGRKAEADQERISATEAFGPNGLPAIHLDAGSDTLTHMGRVKTELDTTSLREEIRTADTAAPRAAAPAPDSIESHIRRALATWRLRKLSFAPLSLWMPEMPQRIAAWRTSLAATAGSTKRWRNYRLLCKPAIPPLHVLLSREFIWNRINWTWPAPKCSAPCSWPPTIPKRNPCSSTCKLPKLLSLAPTEVSRDASIP